MAVDPSVDAGIATASARGAAGMGDVWAQLQGQMVIAAQNDGRRMGMEGEQILFNNGVIDAKSAANTPNQGGVGPGAPAAPK